MRDIVITLIVFGSLPYILSKPYIGVLVWSWLGYMNPHRLAWGFAYDMPFAQIVAIVLFISLAFNRETKRIPVTGLTVLWGLFLGWMCLSTLYAVYPDGAQTMLVKVFKIQLIIWITMMVMVNRQRIELLLWVIVGSIGYFSIKGGVFTLATGGAFRVWGPTGSYVEGNNELALATLMVLPLMWYLRSVNTNKWVRLGLLGAIILSAVSAFGSHSRGALLAGLSMAFFLWLKGVSGMRKIVAGIAIVGSIALLMAFMPDSWHERMGTIQTYEEDASAMGRIHSWLFAYNVANDRFLGAGFEPWSFEMFAIYRPESPSAHAAHSIYFSVLGEHGWGGLILFLLILWVAWRTASGIIREVKGNSDMEWLAQLARMLQVSLVAYCTGGAFLSLSYYDLPWHIISLLVIGKVIAQKSKPDFNQSFVKS